jgi:class 3 adenylate cyclase
MAACPTCHSSIDPGDRFCAKCGTALTTSRSGTPAPRAEHRLVTALYVDLVGSTGLGEVLDPENLATVVGAVHEAVRTEVSDRGGSVGAFVGDGVLGVFGLPTSHDDDPVRALRAAGAVI